jgi:hypothetical protein
MAAPGKFNDNPVAQAVELVGGPTQASFTCRVSAATIYQWRKLGYVPDAKSAVLLSRATGGEIGVAILAGVDAIGSDPNGGLPIERPAPLVDAIGVKKVRTGAFGTAAVASARKVVIQGRAKRRRSSTPLTAARLVGTLRA